MTWEQRFGALIGGWEPISGGPARFELETPRGASQIIIAPNRDNIPIVLDSCR